MKEIKLTKGKVAIVDDEDFDFIKRLGPVLFKREYRTNNRTYGKSFEVILPGGHGKNIWYIKHFLLRRKNANMVVEARNGNNLDLRKKNLVIIPREVSMHHNLKALNKTSKYKGVCLHKKTKKWEAYCHRGDREKKYIGIFNTEKEAAIAYNERAKELFGDMAYQNKV